MHKDSSFGLKSPDTRKSNTKVDLVIVSYALFHPIITCTGKPYKRQFARIWCRCLIHYGAVYSMGIFRTIKSRH